MTGIQKCSAYRELWHPPETSEFTFRPGARATEKAFPSAPASLSSWPLLLPGRTRVFSYSGSFLFNFNAAGTLLEALRSCFWRWEHKSLVRFESATKLGRLFFGESVTNGEYLGL